MTNDKQARADALEIVEGLLEEIYAEPELTPQERSIVGQLETLKGILTPDDEKPAEPEWVLTDRGQIMVQIPDDNQWGFSLHDGETSWPGGLEAASSWTVIENDNNLIKEEHREAMDWLFGEDYDTSDRKARYE